MSRHAAEQSASSRIREHQAWALRNIGQARPGFGRHREDGTPRTWSAIRTRIVNMPDECIPCEQIKMARKRANA